MKTHEWLPCMYAINNCLPKFPCTGKPEVEPSKLDNDKIKEIAKYRIPYNWQQQMCLQNFDVMEKTIPEFIDFCTCLKVLEVTTDSKSDNKNNDNKSTNSKKRGQNKKNNEDGSEGEHHCILHRKGNYDTSDCWTLKQFVKKRKDTCNTSGNSKSTKFKMSKEEFHTMFKECVKEMKKSMRGRCRIESEKVDCEELNAFDDICLRNSDTEENDSSEAYGSK